MQASAAHPAGDEVRELAVAVAAPPDRALLGNAFLAVVPLGRFARLGVRRHEAVGRVVSRFRNPVVSKGAAQRGRCSDRIRCSDLYVFYRIFVWMKYVTFFKYFRGVPHVFSQPFVILRLFLVGGGMLRLGRHQSIKIAELSLLYKMQILFPGETHIYIKRTTKDPKTISPWGNSAF